MERTERHSYNRTEGVPFSRGIREFIAESRKCQTLYSNFEGAYERRIFKKEDEDSLKDYIHNTIYYSGGDDFRLSDKNRFNSQKVESLQRKIFSVSSGFGFQEETHVSVIWVYYYVFGEGRSLSVPVFKIYKTRSREDAVFLTVDLSDHESWDSYLENVRFPDAFLCVPRHGQYHIDDEEHKLDLEFVTSRRALDCSGRSSTFSYRPFSQKVIRPLIVKFKSFAAAVHAKIMEVLEVLKDFWTKNQDRILKALVFILITFGEEICDTISPTLKNSNFYRFSNIGLMLLNDVKKRLDNRCYVTMKELSVTDNKPSLTVNSRLLGTQSVQGFEGEQYESFNEILRLFKEPRKNWKKILKNFCSLYRKCRPVLMAVLSVFCPCPILMVITVLLNTVELLENLALNPTEEFAEEIAHSSFPASEHSLNQNEVKPSTSFGAIKKCLELHNSAEKVGGKGMVSRVSVEKLLEALPNLEEDLARNIVKKAVADDLTALAPSLSCPVVTNMTVEVVDDFRICFIPNASVPQLTDHIKHILDIPVLLEPRERFFFHVITPSGSVIGYLYFPQDFSVVALFPLQSVKQK